MDTAFSKRIKVLISRRIPEESAILIEWDKMEDKDKESLSHDQVKSVWEIASLGSSKKAEVLKLLNEKEEATEVLTE